MRALVAGWFSFEQMGATAGDLLARDVVTEWLRRAGCPYDVALAAPFEGGVDWQQVDPDRYTHLVFVCGPFGRSWQITRFLDRFDGRRLIGVNLSMLDPLQDWNPFHLLLERDSSRAARPDLSFLAEPTKVPVAGVVLIDSQPEYQDQDRRAVANTAILNLVAASALAAVRIDTRLDANSTGFRSAAEIESLIARADVVLTTRMHGLVLALKNGVPAVAVDPVAGGAKLTRQARTLGWPYAFVIESALPDALGRALEYCLTAGARAQALQCADRARLVLLEAAREFAAEFGRAAAAR